MKSNISDLDDLMAFQEVVISGSFTKAAVRLNIPKANLSRKVSRLEADLGVVLLERTTRSQTLTEQGRIFFQHCQKISSELDLATSSLSESITDIAGPLKIGSSVGIAHEVLKEKLFKFISDFPSLSLDLVLTNQRVDLVSEGYDILIRVGNLDDSSLIAKKLGSINRKLFCHPSLVKGSGKILSIEHLKTMRFLLMGSIQRDEEIKLYRKNKLVSFRSVKALSVDDFSLLKQAAIDRLGVAILPTYMCKKELAEGSLVHILPEWGMSAIDVYALFPKHRSKIMKVRVFLDFLERVFDEKLADAL